MRCNTYSMHHPPGTPLHLTPFHYYHHHFSFPFVSSLYTISLPLHNPTSHIARSISHQPPSQRLIHLLSCPPGAPSPGGGAPPTPAAPGGGGRGAPPAPGGGTGNWKFGGSPPGGGNGRPPGGGGGNGRPPGSGGGIAAAPLGPGGKGKGGRPFGGGIMPPGMGNGGGGTPPGNANGGGIMGCPPRFCPSMGLDEDWPSAAYEEVIESMTDWAFS